MELMLALAVSALVLVPLLAWMVLALDQEPVRRDGLVQTAQSGLVGVYFPRDVAVAGAAAVDQATADAGDVNWEDCRNGDGEGGRRLLVLVRSGQPRTKVVYSEAPSAAGGGSEPAERSIWRRECEADTGRGTESTELMERVPPGAAQVSCPDSADGSTGGVVCGQVELRLTPPTGAPVALRALRRVDSATVAPAVQGNRVPVAKIEVVAQSVRRPYKLTLSSASSRDPEGRIVCFEWSFPTVADGQVGEPARVVVEPNPDPVLPPGSSCPGGGGDPGDTGPGGDPQQQVRTLPTSGTYYIELTVTDDRGVSATTYKRIDVVPPDPVASARVRPVDGGGVAGSTLFEFAARWYSEEDGREIGSDHPDGTIAQYEWVIRSDTVADATFVALRSDPSPWYLALPDRMVGNVTITLTVSDLEGRTNSTVTALSLQPATPTGADVDPSALGGHPPPVDVRVEASDGPGAARLVWTPDPTAEAQLVELSHDGPDCSRQTLRVLPAAAVTQALLPNECPVGATSQARVGSVVGGTVSWSPWIDAPVPAFWAPEIADGTG